MAKEPLLKPEEVASVLSSEDGKKCEAAKIGEGPPLYSLRRPVAIAPEDEADARKRLERMAAALGEILHRELESEIRIEVEGFQQEQTGAAVRTLPEPAWVLSFLHGDGGGVALALDPTCALSLVELALGGAGNTSATGREPTTLESRVLTKLCGTVATTLGRTLETTFKAGTFQKKTVPESLATPGQTVGIGVVKIQVAETSHNGLLLATPGLLREAARRRSPAEGPVLGPLAERIRRAPVETRAVLKAGLVSLSDLVAFEVGSVLQLDASEKEPLVLQVNRRDLFHGQVVRREDGPVFEVSWRRGRRKTVRTEESK